jgi:transcriptional regulator with XRE-family HTH domain
MSFVAYPVHNAELGKFLVSRRTRLSPEACGLPSTRSRRRTPGLRREDVSSIAGISTAYYTWIEQGRPFDISVDVLYAIAGALQLSDAETDYVFVLAGKVEQRSKSLPTAAAYEAIMQVVDHFKSGPALALTPWLDVLGVNAAANDLFQFEPHTNLARWFFCYESTRLKICNSTDIAEALVALLRRNCARASEPGEFRKIIDDLRADSGEFQRLWDGYVVESSPRVDVEFERSSKERVAYRTTVLCDPVATNRIALFMTPQPP